MPVVGFPGPLLKSIRLHAPLDVTSRAWRSSKDLGKALRFSRYTLTVPQANGLYRPVCQEFGWINDSVLGPYEQASLP